MVVSRRPNSSLPSPLKGVVVSSETKLQCLWYLSSQRNVNFEGKKAISVQLGTDKLG